ncbi:MAG: hypothetical protein IPJ34_29440 [Myxococcales bacterium]|nr:hypothetical protein [Myxococcales bacterium]
MTAARPDSGARSPSKLPRWNPRKEVPYAASAPRPGTTARSRTAAATSARGRSWVRISRLSTSFCTTSDTAPSAARSSGAMPDCRVGSSESSRSNSFFG